MCVSVKLAPGLCQPITPSLFCVCVREWAVCSGLTDCFPVIGTLITAPTLSQASASLPPSSPPPAMRRGRLQTRTALFEHELKRAENRGWKTQEDMRKMKTRVWEHGGERRTNQNQKRSCQFQPLSAGEETQFDVFGRGLVSAPGLTPQSFNPRPPPRRNAALTVMHCTAQCAGGRSGLKERKSLCEGKEKREKA